MENAMTTNPRRPTWLPLRSLALVTLLGGLALACGPRNGSDVTPARDTAAAATDTSKTGSP
jgi:hypothetical protein